MMILFLLGIVAVTLFHFQSFKFLKNTKNKKRGKIIQLPSLLEFINLKQMSHDL